MNAHAFTRSLQLDTTSVSNFEVDCYEVVYLHTIRYIRSYVTFRLLMFVPS